MKKINGYGWGMLSVVLVALSSCSTEALSEYERTQNEFLGSLNGEISPMQMWRTAVTLRVNVTTKDPARLWLMSGNDKGMLFDYREVAVSGSVSMVAPQGQGNTLYLVSVCNREKRVQTVPLNGKTEEVVNLNLTASASQQSSAATASSTAVSQTEKAAASQTEKLTQTPAASDDNKWSLSGHSILGDAEYHQLTNEQLSEGLTMLETSYIEYQNAKKMGFNTDYELESKGDFRITWFAGNCMSSTPHTLGYYYHSPGTYDDIQYVDISETEIYDYIDGLAKVQYKVNEDAAQKFGVEADHWYDANFDMGDKFENPYPYLKARLGDDAYSSIDVFHRYGRNITGVRGVSFILKVPAGKRVGFYDRIEDEAMPEQYDRFERIGIKPYTSRENFKAMNFSCEAMNMNMNGPFRSCIVPSANAYWLGMENDYTGGDLDCNDVIFEVSADLDIYRPSVVEPDLAPFGEYQEVMPWTIAYEDVHRNADYDFNDAVIRVMPDYEKEQCCVTVMAAGCKNKMYLHYNGPDGDQNLGEIHELLGGDADSEINTKTSMAQYPFASIDCVKWPKGYTMQEDAKRFYIEVVRGDCKDCSDVITLAEEPGKTPEALLVAGEWKWPKEGVNIMTTYDTFANWSKDITKIAYWNWYSYPKSNTYVNY